MPLRGKIVNVEKSSFEKVLSNEEIKTIITAVGTGIGEKDFDLSKLRYHKIIIMTDADVDGSHIRTLLLTFFYRQMPQILEKGHVYIAQPPLYKIKRGNDEKYLKDDKELNQYLLKKQLSLIQINDMTSLEDKLQLADTIQKRKELLESLSDSSEQYSLKYFSKIEEPLANILKDKDKSKTHFERFKDFFSSQVPELNFELVREEESFKIISLDPYGRKKESHFNFKRAHSLEWEKLCSLSKKLSSLCALPLKVRWKTQHNNPSPQSLENPKGGQEAARQPLSILEDNINNHEDFYEKLLEEARKGSSIQRYKGLGEMNPEQLWETTLDSNNRHLVRVTLEEGRQATDETFSILMGKIVEPRKQFIIDNALLAGPVEI